MKKSLSKAVALAATLGAAASAHAVNVDQNGLGQVLLYPIYTAEEGNVTAIHVTNTTDEIKAVKVRFVEGMNSQEVLDFNLYLSPNDVWTGGVVQTATGAALVTQDKSCTAGKLEATGQEFRNYNYQADSIKTGDRARVGHLEVIEMGVVDPAQVLAGTVTAGQAIIHGANGAPGNCDAVVSAWGNGGLWRVTNSAGVSAPTGGLYGTATVVNVEKGIEFGVEVTAIDNFVTGTVLHAYPGTELPSLANAQLTASYSNGATRNFANGIDAVSSVLMKESIKNDYAYGAGLNAQTDFVITFPTKSHYVDGVVRAPFTNQWNPVTSQACEAIDVVYYDREEGSFQLQDDMISPQPPAGEGISLCYETNVFSAGTSKVVGGEYVRSSMDMKGFQTGWMNIDLTGTNRTLANATDTQSGLPVIGFAVTAIQNGDVGGLLSNYAGSYTHKATATVLP